MNYDSENGNSDSIKEGIERNDSSLDESWRSIQPDNISDSAKQSARTSEQAASKADHRFTGGVSSARDAESSFKTNVSGQKSSKPDLKLRLIKRKKGPLAALLAILFITGGLISLSQTFAPFGLIANGLDQFNVLRTSMNRRSNFILTASLGVKTNKNTNIVKSNLFTSDRFTIGKRIQNKLAQNGIQYLDDADGNGLRLLVYTDPETGSRVAIAASEADVNKIPNKITMPDGSDIEISSSNRHTLISAGEKVRGFDQSLDISTRTMKGHIAGWFDSVSDSFHKRIQNSRNRFKGIKSGDSDEEVVAAAKKSGLSEEIIESDTSKARQEDYIDVEKSDDKGNTWIEEERIEFDAKSLSEDSPPISDAIPKGTTDPGELEEALSSRARAAAAGSVAKDTASSVAAIANVGCVGLRAVGAINAAIAGIHVANTMNFVTGFLNAVQQTQIEGDATAMNYYLNKFSQLADTKDIDDNIVRSQTNTFSSPAYATFFGGPAIKPEDPLAKKFNKDYVASASMQHAWGGDSNFLSSISSLGGSIEAYKTCIAFQGASSAVGLAIDLAGLPTLGLTAVFDGLIQKAAMVSVMTGVGLFIATIIPHVAKWMAMDLITNMAGEDAAYAINSGFNMYLGQQMQASSGLPGNKEQVVAQYRETQVVIAKEAEYDRATRSPLDPSSKNTFLGSIVHAFTPFALSLSSPLRSLSGATRLVGSSMRNIIPQVGAASDEAWFKQSLNENCPSLSQIGLVGDAYCNPYFVSNYSTIETPVNEVYEAVAKDGSFDGEDQNGNPKIKEKSEFSKWILACAVRQSQFGSADPNIIGTSLTGSAGLDAAINTGLGLIPLVGDASEIKAAIEEGKNLGWTTGVNCKDPKYKYYSRYSEDQRLLEAMGVIDKSSVTAFLEEHYTKHPLDQSFEGLIARYSGMTKSQVNHALGLIEYMNYIAKYNPTSAGPLPASPASPNTLFESTNSLALSPEASIPPQYLLYNDPRQRHQIA